MDNIIKNLVIEYLNKYKLCLYLEGLISAGKSTFCKSVEHYLNKNGINFNNYPEPINDKLLNLFYSDMKTHAFSFQSITIRERVHLINNAYNFLHNKNKGLVLIDRSCLGDCAFALMHYKSNNISDEQFIVYADLAKPFKNNKSKDIKKTVVNLDCTPNKARERLIQRGKINEMDSCSIVYLNDLKNSYNQVFTQQGTIKESNIIKEIYNSMDISVDNIINIDYNIDHKLINGILSEETTFKILYEVISNMH